MGTDGQLQGRRSELHPILILHPHLILQSTQIKGENVPGPSLGADGGEVKMEDEDYDEDDSDDSDDMEEVS